MAFLSDFRKQPLRYPIGSAPRTAVLVPWFRAKDKVRVFPQGWSAEAEQYSPEAIVGTREQLLTLAEDAAPAPARALIVVALPGSPLLTDQDRERLWRAFGVPAFQQIVTESGELLAAECEAHDGLHASAPVSGFALDQAPCPCGLTTPRLIARKPAEKAQAAAALSHTRAV